MNPLNSDFSFYRVNNPDIVLRDYIASYNNLYDQSRYRVTADFLNKYLPLERMNILEIGCGGGSWSSFFGWKSKQLTCIDIRPHVIEAAKLYVSLKNSFAVKDSIRWFAGDIKDIPYDDKFDFVFIKDVIEHIIEDFDFMKHISGRISKGGYMYIATQNSVSLNYAMESVYEKVIRGNKNWCGWDPTHVRFYNSMTLKNIASSIGFSIVSWHGMYHMPYRFLTRLIFRRVIEHNFFHWIERHLGEYFPFSITGWAIGVLLKNND